MRVCLDIEFQDAIVCILGGGKVALRKAKQFLEAGATIYIHSIQYEPEYNISMHIIWIYFKNSLVTVASVKFCTFQLPLYIFDFRTCSHSTNIK